MTVQFSVCVLFWGEFCQFLPRFALKSPDFCSFCVKKWWGTLFWSIQAFLGVLFCACDRCVLNGIISIRKDREKVFLRNISLLYLIGIFFGPIAAFGGSCFCGYPGNDCSTNQHCVETWFWDDEAQMMDNDFYCEDCPAGYGHSETDCFECVPCAGYNDACPNYLADHIRCKDLGAGCPNGCHKYGRCDSRNGNILDDLVDGPCHTEGETCYSNTRACSEFSNEIINQGMGCTAVSQLNYQAEWQDNKWDAINCKCEVENADTEFLFRCKQLNLHASVQPANRYLSSASSKIRYTLDYMYCGKCYPGYLPDYQNSPYNGANIRPPNISGNWGVVACLIEVTQPDYADGCVIKFNLQTGQDAQDDCRKVCPTGSATDHDGAQSIEECIPDYSQTYEDGTGWFVLGGFETCP